MNMGNTATLGDFAVAGFLADIGKSYISPEVLRKPGNLDGNDLRNIRRHPIHTVEHVGRHFPASSPIIKAILHHHVRIDGTGYPNLHGRTKVSVMAQVIGVADIFDGITTDRPDRAKSAPYEALEFLTREMRGKFSDDLIKSFIRCLGE